MGMTGSLTIITMVLEYFNNVICDFLVKFKFYAKK